MGERIKVTANKPLSTKENSASNKQKTGFRSQSSHVDQILFLQRTIGNQAVQRMLRSGALQAKLRIGQPGDVYEQEADRVADEVMRMPEPGVQRQIEEEEEEEILQTKPLVDQITPLVQRQVEEEEEEEMLQTKNSEDATSEVTNDLESQINAIKGGGQPLAESERAYFEPRFGADFSRVRVHTDTRAADSARAVNARAFTVGRDMVFGVGQYAPGTSVGRRLLTHELTHVIQQCSSAPAIIQRACRPAAIGKPSGCTDLGRLNPRQVLQLQGTIGNRTVGRLFAQTSQNTGPAPYPRPFLQRTPAEPAVVVQAFHGQEAPSIQREISGDYTIAQLRTYLEELNQTGRINGSNSGDNMARDVVSEWLDDLTFSLTPGLKILLIRELQDGTVGDDDERAILALLQHSYNDEMSTLFGPGGIDVGDLDSDMQRDEQDELDAFYESRFQGGKEAVRRGEIQPQGRQEPLLPTSEEGWDRARIQDCMHQSSGVLPGRIGPLTQMRRTMLVFQHFTEEELDGLEQLIRANRQARRFVCTCGLPGLLAVSDTLDGTTIDIEAARTRLESGEISGETNRPFLRRQRRSRETVGDVTEWARRESRPVTVPSMASIVGLPEEHQNALERVLLLLQSNTVDVGRLSSAFQQAVTAATNTPTRIQQIRDSSYWRQSRFPYEPAVNASSAAEAVVTALQEANRYIEMTDFIEQARTLQTSLEALPRNYRGELSDDQRYEARDQLRGLKESARELREQIRGRAQRVPGAESFERVRYLLTYFLAMNDPDREDASTAAQRQEFIASVADFNDDLRAVFGTGAIDLRSPIELLEVLGRRLGAQMSVRNQMAQRLNQDPGALPGMGTVRSYFQSLNGQPLATIEQAYERYAEAYFEHRGLNNQADLAVDEFSDLFNRPIGIGGTRLLVCSGFARLGAQLLMDAGATLVEYRIRFHYTPADVAAQSFSDGHAVAVLSLGGTHLWVSNQSINHSQNQAMNVAWTNPDAPTTEGVGSTLEAATGDLSFPTN